MTTSIWGQLLPTIVEVDSVFSGRCNEGQYLLASNYILDCANKREKIGDKKTALDYQLRNCKLIEEHLGYFIENGLTRENYYFNWMVVSILYNDLGYLDECISTYLNLIKQMKESVPEMLSTYSRIIATTLSECTSEQYRDSIYSLSFAMDVITKKDYSKRDIESFNWMAYCFYWNRFNNSFKDGIKYNDRIYECDSWFNKYKWFIDSLDRDVYKDEVVNYYIQYIDILLLLASTINNQEKKHKESIELLNKGVEYLTQIKGLNDTIPFKIASFYSEIANGYMYLRDNAKAKEYCDKTIPYILDTKMSIEYCDILASLAANYKLLNQDKEAAFMKKTEIEIRKNTSMPPVCSDYALYMAYNVQDTITNIKLGMELEKRYGNSDKSMSSVYLYMADAFSKMMHVSLRESKQQKYSYCKEQFDKYINKAEEVIKLFRLNDANEQELGSVYNTLSSHYARLGNIEESFIYAEKFLHTLETMQDDKFYDVSVKAAALHNKEAVHRYLPKFYKHIESEIKSVLPVLGSVESGYYLEHGNHNIYRIPEWAAWNPDDSVCTTIAYDATLLIKGLLLQFSSLAPSIGSDKTLNVAFSNLNLLKDSILRITDEKERILATLDYEQQERTLRISAEKNNLLFTNCSDVRRCLYDNEIAIEFVCYDKNNYVWKWKEDTICKHYVALILDKKHNSPILIDLFDENELINVYNYQPKSYTSKEGIKLYNLLWGKLGVYLDNYEKIYFSPMGLLSLINIEALEDENGICVSQRYSLKRLSSTKQLLHRNETKSRYNIALFGGIDYTSSEEQKVFTLDSLNTRGNWVFLSGTKKEIENIYKECLSIPNTSIYSYVGDNATETSFKKLALSNSNIIHIATHGFFIPEEKRIKIPYYQCEATQSLTNSLFYSGLVFAGGQDCWNNSKYQLQANDGILTAYEISTLNLSHVDMVVLSACETGIGETSYDGIIGLQRAFKMAGVKTIVMSLWKVDDIATSYMMETFYTDFLRTGSKYDAFKYAINKTKEKYPDPYCWASFIMLD